MTWRWRTFVWRNGIPSSPRSIKLTTTIGTSAIHADTKRLFLTSFTLHILIVTCGSSIFATDTSSEIGLTRSHTNNVYILNVCTYTLCEQLSSTLQTLSKLFNSIRNKGSFKLPVPRGSITTTVEWAQSSSEITFYTYITLIVLKNLLNKSSWLTWRKKERT